MTDVSWCNIQSKLFTNMTGNIALHLESICRKVFCIICWRTLKVKLIPKGDLGQGYSMERFFTFQGQNLGFILSKMRLALILQLATHRHKVYRWLSYFFAFVVALYGRIKALTEAPRQPLKAPCQDSVSAFSKKPTHIHTKSSISRQL